MARIMQEKYLTDRQKTEGYMVAVDADTYEEARAIAYRRWAEMKPEVFHRMEMESVADMMALMGMIGIDMLGG